MKEIDCLDSRAERAKFIEDYESSIYTGKTTDGREVIIFLQQGEGMKVLYAQREKPNWWEVVYYDANGYQEGISYEPRYKGTEQPKMNLT